MTREQWLNDMVTHLRPLFEAHGYTVPENVRITCGFPSQKATARSRRIGECWDSEASDGKVFEIFISPVLHETLIVAATVAHELVHATVGLHHSHRAPFAKCARAIGLEGKMTATVPGERFQTWFDTKHQLGAYPHQKLNPGSRGKKQTTRMIKVACPNCTDEPYVVRMSRSTLELGLPSCGACGSEMVEA